MENYRFFYYKQYNNHDLRFISTKKDLYKTEKKDKKKYDEVITDDLEIKRISQSRVKRKIRELILCNDFDYFCTWTVDSASCDRFSLQDCQDKMTKLIQKLSRINRKNGQERIHYIWVTEKHENGAFHFHGVIKNLFNRNYINENGYMSNSVFDELGYFSCSPIKDKSACACYIMKYITKDSIQNEKGSYYFRSHGLNKPPKPVEILPIDFNIFVNHKTGEIKYYENDYCRVSDVSIPFCDKQTLLYLQENLKENDNSVINKLLKVVDNFSVK